MSQSTNNLFVIDLPEEWADQTVYTIAGPEDSGVKHNLVISVDTEVNPENVSIFDIAKQRIESLKQNLPGLEILKEEEKVLPKSRRTVFEVVYKYTPHDNKTIFQKQVYLIDNNKCYSFVSSFSKTTIKTVGTIVDDIIDSIRPINLDQIEFDS